MNMPSYSILISVLSEFHFIILLYSIKVYLRGEKGGLSFTAHSVLMLEPAIILLL